MKRQIPSAVIRGGEEKFTWLKDIRELSIGELIEIYAYAEAIVETVREPLVILDKNLRVRSANAAFFTTFQTTKEKTYGKFIYQLNSGEWNIPALRKLLSEILPKNTSFKDFEVTHDFEKIGRKVMVLNARRIILEENNTELILLAIEDITERKRLEELKDDFINIASHEIKTPITSIKTYLHIIQKRLEEIGNQKDKEIMENLINQTNVLTNTANRLLEDGRVQAPKNKNKNKNKKIYLDTLIEKVVREFKQTQNTSTITIHGASKAEVFIDKESIEEVLVNLLTNAVKYSPPNGKITIRIAKQENEVVVSVQDNGVGIDKENQGKIFERYYRADETNVKGFGLGLYIAKKIIMQHGGAHLGGK